MYQIGGIRHPGISDIDLLVVARDGSMSKGDPLAGLPPSYRCLFTHACFLVPRSLAPDLAAYVQLDGYRLLHGTAWPWATRVADETSRALAVQTAIEFLAKNLLDLHVQLSYGLLKTRVFLQHVKGLRLDIETLGMHDHPISRVLGAATPLIDEWFQRANPVNAAVGIALDLLPLLRDALTSALDRATLYAPTDEAISFASNMSLRPGSAVEVEHHGIRLPRLPGLEGRRKFNANHRVSRFVLTLPMTPAQPGSYHAARFDFLRRTKLFVTRHFPAYAAPIPPLFYRAL